MVSKSAPLLICVPAHHQNMSELPYFLPDPQTAAFMGFMMYRSRKKWLKKKVCQREKKVRVHWEELNCVIANLHKHKMLHGARREQALLFKKKKKKKNVVIFHHNKTHERYIVSVKY